MENRTKLYKELKPLIAVDFGGRGGNGGASTAGTLIVHDINSYHSGNLLWSRVDKSGASLSDFGDLDTFVRTNVAATITARHSFSPLTVGQPFTVTTNGSTMITNLNANKVGGQLESVFMRKNANSDLDMNNFIISSDNDDTQFLLGRTALGYVGHSSYAGFAVRGYANATGYGMVQYSVDGSLHINRPNTAVMYFKEHNVEQARFEGDEFVLQTPMTIKADNYASQTSGWGITYGGAGDFRYLYADEMHVKSFIADLEQALAGGQIICKSVAELGADFTVPNYSATATLTVKSFPGFPNAYVFSTGDTIAVRIFSRGAGTSGAGGSLTVAFAFGTVSAPSINTTDKIQTWTFTRLAVTTVNGIAAGGTASNGTVVEAGAIVLDFGVSSNGYYEVNAIDGLMGANSPYAQIVTWSAHPWYDRTVQVRMGNLTGLGFTGEYGIYAQGASNDEYIKATGAGILTRNLSYNAYNSSTHTMEIQPDGDFFIGSNIAAAATTTLAVFGANRTYNSEAVTAGDIVLGNHNAANSFWDISAGQLKFRSGTTTKCYIDTTGEFVSGAGNVRQSSDGLNLERDDSLVAVRARSISWWNDVTVRTGDPKFMVTGYLDASSIIAGLLRTKGIATFENSVLYLEAETYSGSAVDTAAIALTSGAFGSSSINLDADLLTSTDAKIGGAWTAVSSEFASGWGNLASYQAAEYRKFGDVVSLQGVVERTSGSSSTILTLPAGFRPAARQIWTVESDTGSTRVDIQSSGVVSMVGAISHGFTSLCDISFSTT